MGRIYLGLDDTQKKDIIKKYIDDNDIQDTWVISGVEKTKDDHFVSFKDCIEYVHYYGMLHNITKKSLLIIDEIMCNSNRYMLNYNCIRAYARKTSHVLIFNYLPCIEKRKDYLILCDIADPIKPRDEKHMKPDLCVPRLPVLEYTEITLSEKEKDIYQAKKSDIIASIDGEKSARTVPARLHKETVTMKKKYLEKDRLYMTCSATKNIPNATYAKHAGVADYILEFPSRMKQFVDYLRAYEIKSLNFIVSDVKVDSYLREGMEEWREGVSGLYENWSSI